MPPSKYRPAADFLAAQPRETASVTLKLAEIEAVLARPLPVGASARARWTNHPSTVQARKWVGLGWHDQQVDVRQSSRTASFGQVAQDSRDPAGD